MKISKVRFSAIIILIIICACVIYNIYDNNRFKVVAQEITIDKLPNEFDGFKILQISDLHGKSFGENQKDLLKTINSLEYDISPYNTTFDRVDTRPAKAAYIGAENNPYSPTGYVYKLKWRGSDKY